MAAAEVLDRLRDFVMMGEGEIGEVDLEVVSCSAMVMMY
jgi:hypothetical protein